MDGRCRTVRHTTADIAAGNIVPEGEHCGREAVIRLHHPQHLAVGNNGVTFACEFHAPTWIDERWSSWRVVEETHRWKIIKGWRELVQRET